MITWQDYEAAENKPKWIGSAISQYMRSDAYKDALDENAYEAGLDVTIRKTMRYIYQITGEKVQDFTSANYQVCSNVYHRLNTQRAAYLLGNGVSFAGAKPVYKDGEFVTVDKTKEALGSKFDRAMYNALYWALCNGESHVYVHRDPSDERWLFDLFKRDEFLPLPDEMTGELRGGIRFWSLDWNRKPIVVVLYTEEGFIRYESKKRGLSALREVQKLTPYLVTLRTSEADGEEVIGGTNYGRLPIFQLALNPQHFSTLKFLRPLIDAQDMILSGLANDLQDCTQMYWTVSNAMGMDDESLTALRDRMRLLHIVAVDDANGATVQPYTQEVPYNARSAALKEIHDRMYGDFGALDVHEIGAGSTNDHISAAYKPMDEEADNAEYFMIDFIQQITSTMLGVDDTPVFQRARIANEKELTEMVLLAADHLDEETLLHKLPFLSVDEVSKVLTAKEASGANRFEDATDDELM